MNLKLKTIITATTIGLLSSPALAQEASVITLKSLDGKVVMTGELQGFEAGRYNIVVAGLGLISVAQDAVICQSSAGECAVLVSES